jgi:hypothetical protein
MMDDEHVRPPPEAAGSGTSKVLGISHCPTLKRSGHVGAQSACFTVGLSGQEEKHRQLTGLDAFSAWTTSVALEPRVAGLPMEVLPPVCPLAPNNVPGVR